MSKEWLDRVSGYMKKHRLRKRWQKAVACLAVVVIFCTIYALIHPAVALDEENLVLNCSFEVHQHESSCFDAEGNVICGYADYVVHTHNPNCYDSEGNLVCPLKEVEAHEHNDSCYKEQTVLACGQKESDGHQHDSSCYEEQTVLVCGQEESEGHQHDDSCYEEQTVLVCDQEESEGHQHEESCYTLVRGDLTCGMEEGEGAHQHSEDCYKTRQVLICGKEEGEGSHHHSEGCYKTQKVLTCEKPEVILHTHSDGCYEDIVDESGKVVGKKLICGNLQVLEHTHDEMCFQTAEVPEPETDASLNTEPEGKPVAYAEPDAKAGDIADYLTEAQILINGNTYDDTPLNPGDQFTVALKWQLGRSELENTLTYTYSFPEQLQIKDVEETVLYDENGNRKGVYSITDGVLTVTYDNESDLNVTSFQLDATWNQEKIDSETTINWNDTLSTTVYFDNSEITVTKDMTDVSTSEDGSLVAKYQIRVTVGAKADNITLTDVLDSEKFHFYPGYYEENDQKYDYCCYIYGSEEYQYGSFPEGTFDENGNQLKDTVTLENISLSAGQTYVVEYAVKLDADDRFELDSNQEAAGLENEATALYTNSDGEDISSSVTSSYTYRAEDKWVIKEKGNLSEEDVNKDTDVPWTIRVNPDRQYNMGGAVIGDSISTGGVIYETDQPMSITCTTDNSATTLTPTWITLSNDIVSDIQEKGIQAEALLTSTEYMNAINTAVGHNVSKDELSNYVFVGESKQQFVWFTPEADTPTTYELSYYTDISSAEGDTLENSAQIGWKQWTGGTTVRSIQEVELKKENKGVYQEGNDYFVDWTITLKVPAGRSPISNVFLYDTLPYHAGYSSCDQLQRLNSTVFDNSAYWTNPWSYLDTLSHTAFTISTDSDDEGVKKIVDGARTSLGHPAEVLSDNNNPFLWYDAGDLRGQLDYHENGASTGSLITPKSFGIWLGELPSSEEDYTITVEYTTKVDPALATYLDGRTSGTNTVSLYQREDDTDYLIGTADSVYWLEHVKVKNSLSKSVADYDSGTGIVTYQVNIDPDASMTSKGADYILRDVLNLPGADFVQNSFQLSFLGTVKSVGGYNHLCWDDSEQTVLWCSDGSAVDLPDGYAQWISSLITLNVENSDNASSNFTLTLNNQQWDFALALPEEYAGRLAPMVLTYQVQLPKGADSPTKETIRNSATLYEKPADGAETLLDGVETEFDYTSVLHKRLSVAPNGNNNYMAAFTILVDKGAETWQNVGSSFTVSDEMSKSLVVDVTSVKVYGVKADGSEEALSDSQYTASYDDQSERGNYLSITITDSDEYDKYRIEYGAKVQGEAEQTVSYDNIAQVNGTGIKSEEISEDVYIQKQSGSVVEINYEVKLLKFDAGNINTRLQATFTLYAWDGSQWTQKLAGLTTDENGELTLNNTLYPGLGLGPNTWYKLVETNAPDGYLKGVTYFHIGQMGEDESKPEEIGSYTTIPLDGGTHQIPNYKASLRLHKTDAEYGSSSSLTGAEFYLYESDNCSGEPWAVSIENPTGIYSFELAGLQAGHTYYLKETKAPDGYILSDTVYTVTIDEEGNVTLKDGTESMEADDSGAYPIANQCGYELPMTGGSGTIPHTVGGLLLLAGAGIFLLYRVLRLRRKRVI